MQQPHSRSALCQPSSSAPALYAPAQRIRRQRARVQSVRAVVGASHGLAAMQACMHACLHPPTLQRPMHCWHLHAYDLVALCNPQTTARSRAHPACRPRPRRRPRPSTPWASGCAARWRSSIKRWLATHSSTWTAQPPARSRARCWQPWMTTTSSTTAMCTAACTI